MAILKHVLFHFQYKKAVFWGGLGFFLSLFIIFSFVNGVETHHETWGKYWKLRPLILTPIIGMLSGLSFYLVTLLPVKNVILKGFVVFFGAILSLIGLWVGIILGLDGTLWD